ncbi:MAG: hypothetical protein ACRDRN_20635 [Sciscionella sp.]
MLARFAAWFSSAAGVWHTLTGCAVIVILEQVGAINDTNGFWLLYWLTVYSAVTQPVLAYTNRQDTDQGAAILTALQTLLEHVAVNSDEDVAADREELVLLRQLTDRLTAAQPYGEVWPQLYQRPTGRDGQPQ